MASSSIILDKNGNKISPQAGIVPLIGRDSKKNEYAVIGTAFYITNTELLVTAKHCVLENKNSAFKDLLTIHFFEDGKLLVRRIKTAGVSPDYDIAYLMAGPIIKDGEIYLTKHFAISKNEPHYGDKLNTYGYPKSAVVYNEGANNEILLNADFYSGFCREFHTNGFGLLKNPCYQTTINIMGGASGGPVCASDGKVIGICSTGYDLVEGEEDISFITPIAPLLEMNITDGLGKDYLLKDLVSFD